MLASCIIFCQITRVLSGNPTEVLAGCGPFVLSFAFLFWREVCCESVRQRIVSLWWLLFAWRWVNNHEVVIEYGIRGLLPVRREKWYYSGASKIFIILILERHLYIFCSDLFSWFGIELVIQFINLVQVLDLYFLIRLFLRENSINYWSLCTFLYFDVVLSIDVVPFNMKTRIDWYRTIVLFILVLSDQLVSLYFVAWSRLVVFVHVSIIN